VTVYSFVYTVYIVYKFSVHFSCSSWSVLLDSFVDPDETFHFYSGQDPAVWFNSYGNRIMVIFFVQGTPLTRLCITTYTVGPKCRRPAGIEQCYPAVSVCFVFIFFCIRVTKTCHIHLSLWLCCGSESGSVSFFACYIQIRIY